MIIFKILANLRIILRFLANFIKNSVLDQSWGQVPSVTAGVTKVPVPTARVV